MKNIIIFIFILCSFVPVLTAHALAADPPGPDSNLTVEEFLQQLSSVPGIFSRKDPFVSAPPPFDIVRQDSPKKEAPILERYPLGDYSVVAVMSGSKYPRALVKIPNTEQVLIVREKDKLGNRRGVIKKIDRLGLTVAEKQKNPFGHIEEQEVVLGVAARSKKK